MCIIYFFAQSLYLQLDHEMDGIHLSHKKAIGNLISQDVKTFKNIPLANKLTVTYYVLLHPLFMNELSNNNNNNNNNNNGASDTTRLSNYIDSVLGKRNKVLKISQFKKDQDDNNARGNVQEMNYYIIQFTSKEDALKFKIKNEEHYYVDFIQEWFGKLYFEHFENRTCAIWFFKALLLI